VCVAQKFRQSGKNVKHLIKEKGLFLFKKHVDFSGSFGSLNLYR
jgi:hypothetical protein